MAYRVVRDGCAGAAVCGAFGAHGLPAPVHPVPLLGVAQDAGARAPRCRRACCGGSPRSCSRDSIGASGSSKRSTWRPSGSRQLAAGSTGAPVASAMIARLLNVHAGWPKKSTSMPSGGPRVLVERKHDRVAPLEPLEHRVERAALGEDAEAGLVEAARDQRVEPGGLIARRTKWNLPRISGKWAMPAIVATSQLPKWPVRIEDALALRERGDEGVDVLDAHQRRLARRATASGSAGTRRQGATGGRSAPARARTISSSDDRVAEDAAQVRRGSPRAAAAAKR